MKPKLHFQRFEMKYIVKKDALGEIRNYLLPYMELDPYIDTTDNNRHYSVVSLYYDSPKLYYYSQKVDGVQRRKKVRLRTYVQQGVPTPTAFIEIKRKVDAVVLKDRINIMEETLHEVLQDESLLALRGLSSSNPLVNEVVVEQLRRQLKPTVLVSYDREPYLGKYNKNIRVTFDYNIRSGATSEIDIPREEMRDVSQDLVVVEVKFNGRLSSYIHDMIKVFDLKRVAYSKYCHGVDKSYKRVAGPTEVFLS